jgi:hypothetical protein
MVSSLKETTFAVSLRNNSGGSTMSHSSETQQGSPLQMSVQLAEKTKAMRLSIKRIFGTMQRIVFVLGIMALATLAMMFAKPDFADKLIAMSPFGTSFEEQVILQQLPLANLMPEADKAAPQTALLTPEKSALTAATTNEQSLVTQWLAKRYRVAEDALEMLVSTSYLIAEDVKIDPLLILSVIAIESRFNPFAESPMGAQGLMQVMSKIHHDKFKSLGGIQAALNPVANVRVGSRILKEYISRAGSVEGGLKMYVGAADMRTDGGYGAKVLSEYANLKSVSTGKRVSIYTSTAAKKPAPAPAVAEIKEKPQQLTVNEHQDNNL